MLAILEKLDIFGVPIKLKTIKQQEQYRTSQSGIITIIIVSLSLAYFAYVIYLWGSGQLIPKVTSSQNMIDYSVYEWDNNAIEFVLYDFDGTINPFTKQNNIILPVLFEISGVLISAEPRFLFSSNSTDEGRKSIFSIDKGKLVLNDVNGQGNETIKQYILFFFKCRSDWIAVAGGNCADEQQINDYYSKSHGLLFLSINLQQYDYINQQFNQIQKTQFFAFQLDQPLYSQIVLQKQKTTVDNGILFGNFNEYEFIRDYTINNQQVSKAFNQYIVRGPDGKGLDIDPFCAFLFRIDNIQTNEIILMPKLGEVLAQIGSIVNIIMLLKFIANMINVQMLEDTILHQIIEIYYPQMKQVEIAKNLFGKIKSVKYKQQDFRINIFLQKYHQLQEIARNKFTFNNLIQELARVQLVLIHQIGIENIKNIFKMEEDMKIFETETSSQMQIQNIAVVTPEESPRKYEFERFELFNYDYQQ